MKVCSIFSQVLKLFSRGGFEKAVKQHKAERHAQGSRWQCRKRATIVDWWPEMQLTAVLVRRSGAYQTPSLAANPDQTHQFRDRCGRPGSPDRSHQAEES